MGNGAKEDWPSLVARDPIDRLVRLYREAIKELAAELVGKVDLAIGGKARVFSLAQNALRILNELDAKTEIWALRNIPQLYRAAQKDTVARLRRFGLLTRNVEATRATTVINRAAIEALVADPERGFTSVLRGATTEIRNRIKTIRDQAKVLKQHQRLINETIARVGVLEGRAINEVRDSIVRELSGLRRSNELVWRPKLQGTGNTILRNMAELPYVRFPRADGGVRHVGSMTTRRPLPGPNLGRPRPWESGPSSCSMASPWFG